MLERAYLPYESICYTNQMLRDLWPKLISKHKILLFSHLFLPSCNLRSCQEKVRFQLVVLVLLDLMECLFGFDISRLCLRSPYHHTSNSSLLLSNSLFFLILESAFQNNGKARSPHIAFHHFPFPMALFTPCCSLPTPHFFTSHSPLPIAQSPPPRPQSRLPPPFPFPTSHSPTPPPPQFPQPPIPPPPQTRYLSAVYIDPYPHPHHPTPSFLSRTATSGLNVLIYARRAEEGGDATGVI